MTDDVHSTPGPEWRSRAKGAQEVAMEYLLHGLHTGRYRAGDQIVPEVVAAEIGVSHVPVREAVRRLEGRGTLTHRPRRGHFVTELDRDDLETLDILGKLLETQALHFAVPSVTSDQITRMRLAIDDGRHLTGIDPIGVAAACRAFHGVMLERGVPKLLHAHLDLMWSMIEPYRPLLYTAEANQRASCVEHAAILDAIEAADLGKAIDAYDHHRTSVLLAVRELIPAAAT